MRILRGVAPALVALAVGLTATPAWADSVAATNVLARAGDTGGVVDVSWTVAADTSTVLGYLIEANTSQGPVCSGDCPFVGGGNTASYSYSGLTNGVSYTFVVYAQTVGGYITSAPSTAAVPFTVPDAPGTPSAERSGSGRITVSWATPVNDGGSDITTYTLSCATGGCPDATEVTSPYEVTGLDPATEYTFTVVAGNDRGDSAASPSSNAVTPYGAPTAPTEVAATEGNAQAQVSWQASDGNGRDVTGYTVTAYEATDSEFDTAITTTAVDGLTTSATVTSLTNGTSYVFRVTATTGTGDLVLTSDFSEASAPVTPVDAGGVTAPATLAKPTGSAGNGQVTLQWAEPSSTGGQDIVSYTATAVEDSEATCTTLVGIDSDPLTCTISGLSNGTDYTFTVTANNGAFDSEPSPASDPLTPTVVAPLPPQLSVTDVTDTSVTVTFSEEDGATYTYSWSEDSVVQGGDISISNGEFTITGIGSNAVVTLTVTASRDGLSSQSDEVTSYTLPTTPTLVVVNGSRTVSAVGFHFTPQNGISYECEAYASSGGTPSGNPLGHVTCAGNGDVTVTHLSEYSEVSVRVSASGLAQDHGAEPVVSSYATDTSLGRPAKPAAPTIGTISTTNITINWIAPASHGAAITNYVIQYKAGSGAWQTFSHAVSTAVTMKVTGLTVGTSYTFRVAGINSVNASDYTSNFSNYSNASASATTLTVTKPVLTVGATTTSSVAFTFPAAANTDYSAVAKIGNTSIAANKVVISGSGNTRTVTVSQQQPGVTVSVTVTATRDGASSTSDAKQGTTKVAVPAPATKVTLTISTKKMPTVKWTASATTGGATVTYAVSIKDSKGKVVATAKNLTAVTWTGSSALAKGSYTAVVVASNSAGPADEAKSSVVTVK